MQTEGKIDCTEHFSWGREADDMSMEVISGKSVTTHLPAQSFPIPVYSTVSTIHN